MTQREVMNVRQAAAYLGISTDTLYRYAATGQIPAFKLGNRWRFTKAQIDRWMDEEIKQHTESKNGETGETRTDHRQHNHNLD